MSWSELWTQDTTLEAHLGGLVGDAEVTSFYSVHRWPSGLTPGAPGSVVVTALAGHHWSESLGSYPVSGHSFM